MEYPDGIRSEVGRREELGVKTGDGTALRVPAPQEGQVSEPPLSPLRRCPGPGLAPVQMTCSGTAGTGLRVPDRRACESPRRLSPRRTGWLLPAVPISSSQNAAFHTRSHCIAPCRARRSAHHYGTSGIALPERAVTRVSGACAHPRKRRYGQGRRPSALRPVSRACAHANVVLCLGRTGVGGPYPTRCNRSVTEASAFRETRAV